MPRISRSLQPSVGRVRLTTTRGRTPGTTSRSSTSPRASRASPTGSAEPTTSTSSARCTAVSVIWLRCGAAPANGSAASASRQKPASTTTYDARRRRLVEEVVERGGPDLAPPVGARQPGEHPQVLVDLAGEAAEPVGVELTGVGRTRGGQQPGDLVEHAEVLGDRAAVGVDVEQERVPPQPGHRGGEPDRHRGPTGCTGRSPHRDHPATTCGDVLVGGRCLARVRGGRRDRTGSRHDPREVLDPGDGEHVLDAEPAQPVRLPVPEVVGVRDRDDPQAAPEQGADAVRVEAHEAGRHHRDGGQPGAGGGEQVREVDAALGQHDARAAPLEPVQGVGLPGGSGRRDQDGRAGGNRCRRHRWAVRITVPPASEANDVGRRASWSSSTPTMT